MKKFCDKISKHEWRVSVPNLNTNLFRRSPCGDEQTNETSKRVSSGSYDVRSAQEEFDKTGGVKQPNDSESESSTFEDCPDDGLYTEIEKTVAVSPTLTKINHRYEYDVPKIHFNFFADEKTNETNVESEKFENETAKNDENIQRKSEGNEKISRRKKSEKNRGRSKRLKSEMKITLTQPEEIEVNELSEDDGYYKVPKRIEENLMNTSIQSIGSFGSLAELKFVGTENGETSPNSSKTKIKQKTRRSRSSETSRNELADQNRLSKSLHDFGPRNFSTESIEHISCSQVLPSYPSSTELENAETTKKKSWSKLKGKINRMLDEQANGQRVGAYADRDKYAINIETMYKNSKHKCKKLFRNTGKMFRRKEDSKFGAFVKNSAFFERVDRTELKVSDIEYVLNIEPDGKTETCTELTSDTGVSTQPKHESNASSENRNGKEEGQNGFEDLRRYVKQGGDFSKELATILQERSEAEIQYSKCLSKLGAKLSRACREAVGGINEAWKVVAIEMETRAETHRQFGHVLSEDAAKPLKVLTEGQQRSRKGAETAVDKASRVLADWRAAEAKSKKHSHVCARDNEKLQDALLDNRISRSTSLIQLPNIHKPNADKDSAKLEGKKRKAEDAVKKADIEYYSHCVRSERARLEWECAVSRGAVTFQSLEEERLNNLKNVLNFYLKHSEVLTPKLTEAIDRIRHPAEVAEPSKDLATFANLRRSSRHTCEQLLPDFYCEHITLAMNRDRRKQALVKLLQLIKLDIERERKSKDGLENLSRAIKRTPNFGTDDSQETVAEKIYHMKSMLTYLEGSRYKVQSALAEMDSMPRTGHPLASHITITRDKAGLQQSVLKVPPWLREQWTEPSEGNQDDFIQKPTESTLDPNNWIERGTADGNSNQHDSDFDEFSSQEGSISEGREPESGALKPISQCKALYNYTPNLPDELAIKSGDLVSVYRQQEDGWWLGECNGSVGIFPATYVEILN